MGQWNILLVAFLFLGTVQEAQAGYLELDLSGNVRKSSIDEVNYYYNQSITGSIAYYFWENSAIEMSYTKGLSIKQVAATISLPQHQYISSYTLMGVDFVLAWGTRASAFRPYLKAGVMQVEKTDTIVAEGYADSVVPLPAKVVPSAGVGIQFMLSQTFAIKVGYDTWPSDSLSNTPVIWDYATRIGVSWYLL